MIFCCMLNKKYIFSIQYLEIVIVCLFLYWFLGWPMSVNGHSLTIISCVTPANLFHSKVSAVIDILNSWNFNNLMNKNKPKCLVRLELTGKPYKNYNLLTFFCVIPSL